MSKVIIISRFFPVGHKRQQEKTDFLAKFWANHGIIMQNYHLEQLIDDYANVSKIGFLMNPKKHTIRKGNRFKKGDYFSPRVWSGRPYHSKQIIVAPDTKIKEVYQIEIRNDLSILIDNKAFNSIDILANNDGLNKEDFINWFSNQLPFKGQIICWNTYNINY
ncbi:hypothetical protein GOQ30_11390 [Flavobacterium sp. TP390]|uniref:Uncharacterized protein n=1 Tax=Flavobacterium profundi TaxID=1774945 RepID=A0A6I4IM77_9FLAO|nr:hypothetical protein [Flavobacterium profundi]MVO09762.1 hypothetical protein [Flavobacterium profundi]